LASPISEGEQIWDLTIGPNSGQKNLGRKIFWKRGLEVFERFFGVERNLVFDSSSGI